MEKLLDKKVLILSTSQSLFAQFGLKKVTTDDIAEQARISKATIYKFYRNKTEIFEDVIQMEFDELFDLIKIAVNKEKTTINKFRAHLITKFSILHDLVNFYNVTRDNWNQFWPYIVEYRRQYVIREQTIVKDIIKFGNDRNELKVKDIDLTSYLMVMALKSMELPWVIEEIKISQEKYIDSMLTLIMNGIKRR
ncbi:MAG: TetR/AcrR family transcriptional regulator [Candidatus Zixiibacteriota bacterium]